MTPDLTNIQLISIGIAIAIATTATTAILLTLAYAEEIRRYLRRIGFLHVRRIPRTNRGNTPFPAHYVVPRFEQRRPIIRATDVASISTTTTTRSLHRQTITIRTPSSDGEYYLSREELPSHHDTELDRLRSGEFDISHSPTPVIEDRPRSWEWDQPEDPGTSEWHIRAATTARDPWGEAAHAAATPDPAYPSGAWNPGDRERALAQNEQDAPGPFARDNVYVEDEQIDASLGYFIQEALTAPRARVGVRSPHYDRNDPFAPLRRNSIPFPTERRRYVPPVPYGQWPDESDSSDSSTESDRGRRQQRGTNPAGARIEESISRLDHRDDTDPLNWEGPDSEWNSLEQIDREILGPETTEAWELRRLNVEARTLWQHAGPREDMEYFLATNRGVPFHFGSPTNGEIMARIHANRDRRLYPPHPGARRPDLRPRTQEEESLLRGQLEILTIQLDERLERERETTE